MDLFQNLQWRISEPSVIDVGTNFIKEETIANSFIFQNSLVAGGRTNYGEDSSHITQENRDVRNKNRYRKSCLNAVQHKQCLQALQLLQSGCPLSMLSQKQQQLVNVYNNLRLSIQQENVEFLKYVEEQWNKDVLKYRKNNLYNFAVKSRMEKLKNVSSYPKLYANNKMIPLLHNQHLVEAVHDACLLELGVVRKLCVPDIEKSKHMNIANIPQQNLLALDDYLRITKQPVSEDVHAEFLAKQTACNFVISSSGLKTIIDNFGPDFNTHWQIPIIVKEYEAYGRKMNVVYIDKTLPKRNIPESELHLYSKKKLIKHRMFGEIVHSFVPPQFILHNFNNTQKQIDNNSSIKTNEIDNSFVSPNKTNSDDSFECSTPKRQKLRHTQIESPDNSPKTKNSNVNELVTPKKQKNYSSELKSLSKILTRSAARKLASDSSESEKSSPNSKHSNDGETDDDKQLNKMEKQKRGVNDDERKILPHLTQSNDDSDETEEEKQVDEEEKQKKSVKYKIKKKADDSHNVSYRLWTLKIEDEENLLMKNFAEKREIKFLVRSKIDGFEVGESGQISPINIVPKLESQVFYGGEVSTKSDLIRQWTTLYFTPLSNLLRVRMNARSNAYVKIEHLNLNKITNECLKTYNHAPRDNLGKLYSVLSNLTDIRPGNYILHHTPKLGPFAALLKAVPENSPSDLNLHEFYQDIHCQIVETTKWLPIDTTCILTHHIKKNIMPGMFNPPNFRKDRSECQLRNKTQKNRSKKKKHITRTKKQKESE